MIVSATQLDRPDSTDGSLAVDGRFVFEIDLDGCAALSGETWPTSDTAVEKRSTTTVSLRHRILAVWGRAVGEFVRHGFFAAGRLLGR